MKILLDHNVWPGLWTHLSPNKVESVRRMGWERIRNGQLTRLAESEGFDAIITFDRTFTEELRGEGFHLRVLTLRRTDQNRDRELLVRAAPNILRILNRMSPGQVEEYHLEE